MRSKWVRKGYRKVQVKFSELIQGTPFQIRYHMQGIEIEEK